MTSRTFKYLTVLPFTFLLGCTNIASEPKIEASSSETALITDAIRDEPKSNLVANIEKINKLVASVKIAEDSVQKDPANKKAHLAKAAADRNEISVAYLKSAELINGSLLLLGIKSPSEASLSKEVVLAMKETALRVRQVNYPLNEFHPEKINLKDFNANISDAFKYFSPDVKNKIKVLKEDLDLAKQARNKEKAVLTLKGISKIYLDEAKTIAINDPTLVKELKSMGDTMLELADAVKKGIDPLPGSKELGLESLI